MKLCILAAGVGSRNKYSRTLPKGFLPIDNKPGITYVIDSIENVDEIVIAIGANGDIYKQFLPLLYPDIKITFVNIENYDGPGSGPGSSLLECSKYLNSEFLLIPTDAYVEEKINDEFDRNWMGVSQVDSTRLFCLLKSGQNNEVLEIYDKDPDAPIETLKNGFNGIAFIKDYKQFFDSLRANKDTINGEIQVSNGFEGLLTSKKGPGIDIKRIDSWSDFGSNENYIKLITKFENQNLIKNDEFTYIYEGFVYKYNKEEGVIKNKIHRAKKLKNIVPEIKSESKNFFSYKYVEGSLLSHENNLEIFHNFLDYCKGDVFKSLKLNDIDKNEFQKSCNNFYKVKTFERLKLYWSNSGFDDKSLNINGLFCKSISKCLEEIDWNYLSAGIPYNFHGDLQPENIIHKNKRFYFIDWRESFGDSIDIGDVYYDLAKLDHALLLSGENVRKKFFNFNMEEKKATVSFKIDNYLLDYQNALDSFILENNYDLKKVKILSSLIYLNISPLYDGDYSNFLYLLGQFKLNKFLYNNY